MKVVKVKFVKQVVIILVLLLYFASYASKSVTAFETALFSLDLPKGFVALSSPRGDNPENDGSTYAFIEGNKERKKSILLVIENEKIKKINPGGKDLALLTAYANALRDTAIKSECKGVVSNIHTTFIGNRKSVFFEKTNQDCDILAEKYWSVLSGKYVITIYLAKPKNAANELFEEVQKSIRHITFRRGGSVAKP